MELSQKKAPSEDNAYVCDLITCYFGRKRLPAVFRVPALMAHVAALRHARKLNSMRTLPRLGSGANDVNTIVAAFSMAVQIHNSLGSWSAIFFAYSLLLEEPLVFDFPQIAAAVQQLIDTLQPDSPHAEERNVARLLLLYIETHEQDPGGILIGRRVNLAGHTFKWTEQHSVFCTVLQEPIPWSSVVAKHSPPGGGPLPTQQQQLASPASSSASSLSSSVPRSLSVDDLGSMTMRTSPLRLKNSVDFGASFSPARFSIRKSFSRKPKNHSPSHPADTSDAVAEAPKAVADLAPMILEWAEVEDDAHLAMLVREYAANVRCFETLSSMKTGDVVLVCFRCSGDVASPNGGANVRFARLVGFVDKKHVAVYLDGREQEQWCVPTLLVRALPARFVSVFERCISMLADAATLTSSETTQDWRPALAALVHPSQTSEMVDWAPVVTEYLNEVLASLSSAAGVDVAEFSSKDRKSFVLSDLYDLRTSIRLIQERKSPLEGLKQIVDLHAERFLDTLDCSNVFIPERRRIVLALYHGHSSTRHLFDAAVGKIMSRLDAGLRSLDPLMEAMRSGERKREMVSWWLALIRSRVMQELYRRGYK